MIQLMIFATANLPARKKKGMKQKQGNDEK